MANNLSKLDANQVIRSVYDESTNSLLQKQSGGVLVTDPFDYVELTNSTIGGKIVPTTVLYKLGGSGGTLVATLILSYSATADLETVTKV